MCSSSGTESTCFYIPEDLLTQILLNCPRKSVVRFQSVCKSWRSLIRSKLFTITYNHLHSSSTPSWSASYHPKQTDSRCFTLPCIWLSRPSRFTYPCKDGIQIVGYIYGALMLKVMDGLLVWNPLDNKYTRIDIKHIYPSVYGMELDFDPYSNKCCGFKVIIVREFGDYNISRNRGYNATVYRLYTTPSISQKEIQWNIPIDITFQQCMKHTKNNSTNLNQACHWIAMRDTDLTYMIVAFDFTSEKFRQIFLPFKNRGFSMIAYKGMLCIGFFQVDENLVKGVLVPFHVNVMKEYGVEESWTSLFVIDIDPWLLPGLIGVTENENLLIHIKKTKRQGGGDSIVSFNPRTISH